MKQLRACLFLLILLPAAAFFSGCSLFTRHTAILWTSVPEFAAYTEVYNSVQSEYQIELVFQPDPAQALIDTQTPPDIIIATALNSRRLIGGFDSLEKMFEKEELNRSVFYPQMLAEGVFEEEQVLLPISFTIPLIVFSSDLEIPGEDTIIITYDGMRSISEKQIPEEEPTVNTIGFVPYWEPEFLYFTTYLQGVDYKESSNGDLMWDSNQILRTVRELKTWSSDINGGLELEKQFADRYLHNPGYKLLAADRILFYFMKNEEFQNIPAEKRENLSFRWYGNPGELRPDVEVLYLGLPKKGKNRQAAKNFLSWFFTEETQRLLLENAQGKRIQTFGIAQGLSSLVQVNEREIPRFFPELTGRIPPKEYITMPPKLPPIWLQMKEEVLIPWLLEQVTSDSTETLETRFENWYLQLPAQ